MANEEAPGGVKEVQEEFRLLKRLLQEMLGNAAEQAKEVRALVGVVRQYHETVHKATTDLLRTVAEADRLAKVALGVLLYKGLAKKEDVEAVVRQLADDEFVQMMKRMMGEEGTGQPPMDTDGR